MLFASKHPNAKNNDEFMFEGDPIVYFDTEFGCCQCGRPTHFVSLCFEAPFCSEECNRSLWEELYYHERVADAHRTFVIDVLPTQTISYHHHDDWKCFYIEDLQSEWPVSVMDCTPVF